MRSNFISYKNRYVNKNKHFLILKIERIRYSCRFCFVFRILKEWKKIYDMVCPRTSDKPCHWNDVLHTFNILFIDEYFFLELSLEQERQQHFPYPFYNAWTHKSEKHKHWYYLLPENLLHKYKR